MHVYLSPTVLSSLARRIPQLGPRKVSGSLSRGTSFLQPPGSFAASHHSSLLPPQPNHVQGKFQQSGAGADLSSGIAAPPRFGRSLSTPVTPRSNQVAAVHEERPQLTIQVPSPLSHGIAGTSLGSRSSSDGDGVSYQSLIPPSPSTHNDNIRVLLRIRPPNSDHDPHQQQPSLSRRCLEVAPDAKGVTLAPSSLQEKRFGFDQVFTETSSQEQIFMDIGVTAVENTINGFNGCIFAYGQTGSGKTFTMLGGTGSNDVQELRISPLRGLTPRIFDHLFRRLGHVAMEKGDALEYSLSCSYLEIYNEKIFDLLEESAIPQPKSIREDANKGVYVEQLRDVTIQTESEAIEWLQFGSRNRRMASTDMNRESSRSHAVFTIKLVQTERTASGVMFTRRSNLHLVDLAGSEKQQQTKAAGQRLKEAAQINKSLSALGNVIMSLVDVSNGQKRHVHYRDSKLTFLLKDSLGGNAITTIVATISGEEKYFSETLSTLKFAQRAKYIKNKAVQNQDSDSLMPLLKQEIERLRQEIAQLKIESSSMAPSPDMSKSSPSNHYQEPPPQEAKKNRWEPALDVMDKLLRASGAAAPTDLEDYEECNPVEVRCERLEMLLYRMICRYEEHKELAFSSDRFHHKHPFFRPVIPTKSFIRAPKKYGVKQQTTENQQEGRVLSPEEEKQILEEIARGNELERENNLMRQELCELLEWKALVEEERKHGNLDVSGYSNAAPEVAVQNHNEELMELLNVYRSLFDEMTEVLQDKRPMLSSPPSPGSGSSFTEDTSVSYASGGEEDENDRDIRESPTDDNEVDISEDGEVSETYREIRRAHAVSLKFEKKLDQYQDIIQRLEKDLMATQDELETSSAATKFAEFQLQQLRNVASEEEARQLEVESTAARLTSELEEFRSALTAAQAAIDAKDLALEDANVKLSAARTEHDELGQLRLTLADAEQDIGSKTRALENANSQLKASQSELEALRSALTDAQQDVSTKDRALADASSQVKACQDELESLRSALADAQQDIDAKVRALEDATRQLNTSQNDDSALEELRSALAAAERDIDAKSRALEDVNSQLERSQVDCHEHVQRFQSEKSVLEARYSESMRAFEVREKQQNEEIKRLLEQTAANSTADVGQLQQTLTRKSSRSDQEKAGVELALLAAQNIIQQLEEELASRPEAGASPSSGNANAAELQKQLHAALADNTELRETIRDLQVKQSRGKRRHSNVILRNNSPFLSADGDE